MYMPGRRCGVVDSKKGAMKRKSTSRLALTRRNEADHILV
jgi:hypothetical protein